MRYSLNRFLSQQLDATRDALLPLAIAVLLTALLVWLLTRWRYRRRFAQPAAEDDAYRAPTVLGSGPVEAASLAPRLDVDSDEEYRARRKALRAVTSALDGAADAWASGSSEMMDRALPNMKLAMTLTRTAFQVPIPAYDGDARANFLASKEWLEFVRPALRADDVEEARRQSADFLRANNLRQD